MSELIILLKSLNEIYPTTPIPLNHTNNYELLVAVLLSAQCTDVRVNTVTPELFSLANTSFKMQDVPVEKIYNIVRPCGLAPQKSKAISNLSKILVEKFNGEVPDDIDALETLPGVGHKTASVVMSQGFGHPAFPVDTHIHRLAQRWGLTNGKNVEQTEKDLKKLFPRKHGTNYIYKLSFTVGSFVVQEDAMEEYVIYALVVAAKKIMSFGPKTLIIKNIFI